MPLNKETKPNPLSQRGYDKRSIFKWNTAGLNSETFSLTVCCIKTKVSRWVRYEFMPSPKGISAKWNINRLVQYLNLSRCVHSLRWSPLRPSRFYYCYRHHTIICPTPPYVIIYWQWYYLASPTPVGCDDTRSVIKQSAACSNTELFFSNSACII